MRLRPFGFGVAALSAAYITAGGVANAFPVESRSLAALCLMPMLSMLASACLKARPSERIAVVVTATALSLLAITSWRGWVDPLAVIGFVPATLEPIAMAVLGGINLVAAGVVTLVFSTHRRVFRFRWLVFGVMGTALFAVCVLASRWTERSNSRQALLRRVVMLEQLSDRIRWDERQELSTALAILGRQHEARAIPLLPNEIGHALCDPPEPPDSDPPFFVTPWREAMTRIAAEERLVLIMEAHTVSEHRAWIEQTLAPLRAAGFTDYRAEAIAEPSSTLKSRGYPTSRTGTYTLDPRFGNLIRTALRLGFDVGGYDLAEGDFEMREEHQAAALAERFAARSDIRMLVHAGHGHVFKHDVRHVGRNMAARLRKRTGVEPFTIWQLSNQLPNDVYGPLIRQVGPMTEPVMLMPPPTCISKALFPESTVHPAVDAIVIHPPRIGREPTDRRGAFSGLMTRLSGVRQGSPRCPIVIAAIPSGEPDDAIAFDQVLLRPGETEFELWLPRPDASIRAWGLDGPLPIHANIPSQPVRVEAHPSGSSR